MYNLLSRVSADAAGSNNVLMLDQKVLAQLVGTSYKDEKANGLIRRRKHLLENFLNLPWFSRAWVYQEAVVAPRVDMV